MRCLFVLVLFLALVIGGCIGLSFLFDRTAAVVCASIFWFFVVIQIFVAVDAWLTRRPLAYGGDRKTHKRVKRGKGLGVDELARRLDCSVRDLELFVPSYRVARIPKRSGGTRQLHIPDASTAKLQRAVLRRLLAKLRVHEAACGFEQGRSIVDNARPHVGQAVVIKMDIVDFFPATSAERIQRYFQWIGWDREVAELLTTIVTHEGGLPQGAPTSPKLSNLVNYYLDVQLDNFAKKRWTVYTRYADDITFSLAYDKPKRVRGTIQQTRRMLKSKSYELNRKKTRILRAHQQQRVTGLVVNDGVNLPRATRRRLRAIEHRLRTTGSASLTESQLDGWHALQHMVDTQRDGLK